MENMSLRLNQQLRYWLFDCFGHLWSLVAYPIKRHPQNTLLIYKQYDFLIKGAIFYSI